VRSNADAEREQYKGPTWHCARLIRHCDDDEDEESKAEGMDNKTRQKKEKQGKEDN